MAGRRLRDAVKNVLTKSGQFDSSVHVVLAGLTNTYSQYVTTFEEYQIQRYEVCIFSLKEQNFELNGLILLDFCWPTVDLLVKYMKFHLGVETRGGGQGPRPPL